MNYAFALKIYKTIDVNMSVTSMYFFILFTKRTFMLKRRRIKQVID